MRKTDVSLIRRERAGQLNEHAKSRRHCPPAKAIYQSTRNASSNPAYLLASAIRFYFFYQMLAPFKSVLCSTFCQILDNDNDSKYAYMKIFGQTFRPEVYRWLKKLQASEDFSLYSQHIRFDIYRVTGVNEQCRLHNCNNLLTKGGTR